MLRLRRLRAPEQSRPGCRRRCRAPMRRRTPQATRSARRWRRAAGRRDAPSPHRRPAATSTPSAAEGQNGRSIAERERVRHVRGERVCEPVREVEPAGDPQDQREADAEQAVATAPEEPVDRQLAERLASTAKITNETSFQLVTVVGGPSQGPWATQARRYPSPPMPKNAFGVTLPSLYSNTPISRLITECVVASSVYVPTVLSSPP